MLLRKFCFVLAVVLIALVGHGCALFSNTREFESNIEREQRTEDFRNSLLDDIRNIVQEEVASELKHLLPLSQSVIGVQRRAYSEALNKQVLGRLERVHFVGNGFSVRARVDTGAQTSSLHAINIEEKEIGGNQYVQFDTFDDDGNRYSLLKRVKREALVRSTSGDANRRFVIEMAVKIGAQTHHVQVNLSDRSELENRFLVGRNLLMGNYIVDVSQSRLFGDEE